MKQSVTDFSIVDHGLEHSQYFQGCGVAFTPYAHVVTGIGNDFSEALDDCLETIASQFDLGGIDSVIRPDVDSYGKDTVPEDSEEIYYHVSIRFNVTGE